MTLPITVRLPRELHQWLRRHAFDTQRSQNSIIVRSLTEHQAMCLEAVEYIDTVDGVGCALICSLPPEHGGLHHDRNSDVSWKTGKP